MMNSATMAFPHVATGRAERASPWDQDAEGIDRAFSEMAEEHASLAYNVAFRMLRNADDAEDAVQEAFISAYRAFPAFKGQSKLSTWLYRIVVNACLMKIRKEKAQSKYLVQTGYIEEAAHDWNADPERAAINGELRDLVESELGKLPPDLRAAVVLRDVQGLSTGEAAGTLKLSSAAFKSRLHRARVFLRAGLEGYLAAQDAY